MYVIISGIFAFLCLILANTKQLPVEAKMALLICGQIWFAASFVMFHIDRKFSIKQSNNN